MDQEEIISHKAPLGVLDTFINSEVDMKKVKFYNDYIMKFNLELKTYDTNIVKNDLLCKLCNSSNIDIDQYQSTRVCRECGNTEYSIDLVPPNTYSDTITTEVIYNYKRQNHFIECLNQLQAKENTTIPPDIITDLKRELKKYNIVNPKNITTSLIKYYLKKLNYSKYYEHVATIINNLCDHVAPKMTPQFENQLRIMFNETQVPFEKYKAIYDPQRSNYLNYNYTMYKMCELLGKDEFLPHFSMLKSRDVLYKHDLIWKGICKDLRWEFIPTI
jgi:hypothetical protein